MDQKLKLNPSTHVHEASYDPDTQRLTLRLNGGTIAHHGVPAQLAQGLQAAPSHGKFYNENIRGKYEHSRVR